MQISLKWVNELVNVKNIKLEDLIEKLTFGGFEVEEIVELEINNEKQVALDISSTANRSDSLSIQGLSLEIAALLNQPLQKSVYATDSMFSKQSILKNASVLTETKDCNMLIAVIVENLTDLTVPNWLKNKLLSSGITPENNLRDFQNYILLETGYPFVLYDFEKITSQLNTSKFNLSVSTAQNSEKFFASNKTIYELDESILLIKANQVPLSIAGIIENQEFLYTDTTKSLLIEGSIFNAAKIRQQSRRLGVKTDRSTRYEKSLKNTYLIEALYRFVSLLRISNPNLKCKLQTLTKTIEANPEPISLRYETIGEILGPISEIAPGNYSYLTPKDITNYLTRLNFKCSYNELKKVWQVRVPHSRTEDITREIDLIEELGRLHGFNNFLITLPKLKTIGNEDSSYRTRKKITACLLNLGISEFIHYSLVPEQTFIKNKISLVNPLVSEYSSLRRSLLPNLVKTIHENFKQGNSFINGFEYGHVFFLNSDFQFQEEEHVAGIFGGLKTKLNWEDSDTSLTWFEAKGKLEKLFSQLQISVVWKMKKDNQNANLFHMYRSANLYLSTGAKIGVFGQIHPILANQLNLPNELYLFEFKLDLIQNQLKENPLPMYKGYSSYPKIIKDISFIVKNDITLNELREIIYANGTNFLAEINLIDEYNGESIPTQHVSLCLELIFQSDIKTLQNKEIEEILENICSILKTKFNATIRN